MKTTPLYFLMVLSVSLISLQTMAQIDLKKKAKTATVKRADTRTDQGINKGLDAVEGGVKSLVSGKDKTDDKKDQAKGDTKTERKTETKESTTSAQQEPGLSSYSKYDFVPGEKVIFFDDFSQDAIGDFPALWNTNASGEVMTTNNYQGHWFQPKSNGACVPLTNIQFTDNYTIEFDVISVPKANIKNDCDFIFSIFADPKNSIAGIFPGDGGVHVQLSARTHFFKNYLSNKSLDKDGSYVPIQGQATASPLNVNKKTRVSIWVQKRRIRVYHEQVKIFDLPTGVPVGLKYNKIRFSIWDRHGEPLLSNIRVAVGLPDTRNKLLTEGKLVTYGIYFDVNSDKVRPESYGTLKSIADVLKENADVKVKIIGHTDGDGDAAGNLDLSKRRAASVKNELVGNFGIDASRIETDGKGKTEPVAANDTPANKAQNRRVEFVKL